MLVAIASKLPYALVLEVGGECVTLNGAKQSAIPPKNPALGVTGGVDEGVFDAWVLDNADSPIVLDKLVFKMKEQT
jgi:hypothetical protein